MDKQYLGDSVYFNLNDYGEVVLTTENGVDVSNIIILEPQVLDNFLTLVEKLRKQNDPS